MAEAKKITDEEKGWAVASYIWVLSLFVLLLKRDSKFVQAHAKQGLLLFIGEVLGIIPGIGWVVAVVSVILAIVGITKVLNNEEFTVPFIGKAWAGKVNL